MVYNHTRPKSFQQIHAEDNAITKFIKKNKNKTIIKIDILVIRINNEGILKNSKPCMEKLYNCKKVNISTDNNEIECIKFNKLYQNIDECTISRKNRII